MRETDPSLKARAKAEDAEIGGADETAAMPEAHVRRRFASKGKTPLIQQPAQRSHSSILRSSNARKRKPSRLVDHCRVHHAQRVEEWLQENKHRTELHDLPSHNPELNPDISTPNGRTLNRRAKQSLHNDLQQNLSRPGVPSHQSQIENRVPAA